MKQLEAKIWMIRCRNECGELKSLARPGVCEIKLNSTYSKIEITLKIPSYIVPSNDHKDPILANNHMLIIEIPRSYPYQKPVVRFIDPSKRIAHCNVSSSGVFCTGAWNSHIIQNTDSILGIAKRVLLACMFDKAQVNVEDPISTEWINFYLDNKTRGIFPLAKPWWN